MGHVVLALSLSEIDHRNVVISREAVETGNEVLADRLQQRRRREGMAPMVTQERHHPLHVLQSRLVDVQIHPIDALHLESDMSGENLSSAAR